MNWKLKGVMTALLASMLLGLPLLAIDVVVTPASVVLVSGSVEHGTAGVAIAAGQVLYKDATDNKLKLADANASVDTAKAAGFALHAAALNQPISYVRDGNLNAGATLTVGSTYVLSATAGNFAPIADLATGHRVTYLGYATTASNLKLMIVPTGVLVP